jgi:hypothetical protein
MRSAFVLAIAVGLVVTACGGSGGGGGAPATPPSPTTTSIAITGYTSALTSPNQTMNLTATATLSNGSTSNVTGQATWASDAQGVATVSSGGVITAVGNGTATISATYSGVVGRVTVTVLIVRTATPTMSGSVSVVISPELSYLYRATLTLIFTETGGVVAYDVSSVRIDWYDSTSSFMLTSNWDPTRIAASFGVSNTVPAGSTRSMRPAIDYNRSYSRVSASVTAALRDSYGNTWSATGTWSGQIGTATSIPVKLNLVERAAADVK